MANAAPIVFTGATVLVGTSTAVVSTSTAIRDYSAFVRAVRFTFEADEHDDTVMGLTSRSRVQGLFSWQAELDFLQSFATSEAIDSVFYDLINTKTKFTVWIRGTSSVRSSDNPEYGGPVRLFAWSPMTGNVGDLLQVTVPLRSAGNLNRFTSAT